MDSEKSKPVQQRTFPEYCPRWLRFFSQIKRARNYVDGKVQGGLLARMTIHWGVFFFATAFIFIVFQAIASPDGTSFFQRLQNSVSQFSLLGLMMLTLMPAFLLDVVRFSNRFAGPMVRLRRCLRELGENGQAPPLKFRDDDFWTDVAKDFNACRIRIYRQQQEIERLQAILNEQSLDSTYLLETQRQKAIGKLTV